MNKKILLFSFLLLFFSIGAFSPFGCNTTKIKGTVYIEEPLGGAGGLYNVKLPGITVTANPGGHTAIADDNGLYLFENLPEGDYTLIASTYGATGYAEATVGSNFSFSCDDIDDVDIVIMPENSIEKPNIYLYPETTQVINVELDVPVHGEIIISDPPYNDGWNVTVTPEGLIDNSYGYLFYEAKLYFSIDFTEGWVVSKSEFSNFFTGKLTSYGFNQQEIDDYIEYWSVNIPDSEYYLVLPLITDELQSILPLEVSPVPDSLLRVWFVIKSISESTTITEPEISAFERSGFAVTEWGVILR